MAQRSIGNCWLQANLARCLVVLLVRLLRMTLAPDPKEPMTARLDFDGVAVDVRPITTEGEDAAGNLLIARCPLMYRPKRTSAGQVVMPDRERKRARQALETTANVIALTGASRRRLASPIPYLVLQAETDDDRAWLAESTGVLGGFDGLSQHSVRPSVPFDPQTLRQLSDRWDGVALLTEALAHDHPTGQLHEFMRLFELAFRRRTGELPEPLAELLDPRFGYSATELRHWVDGVRHPATHADQRTSFALEPDVRPYIDRIEQAAFDVLFNKAVWRDPSTSRRAVWRPVGGTVDADHTLVLRQHSTPTTQSRLLDRWGEYPLDLGGIIRSPDPDWWPRLDSLKTRDSTIHVVPAAEWDGVSSCLRDASHTPPQL